MEKLGHQILALLTGAIVLQVMALVVIGAIAITVGKRIRATTQAKTVTAQRGLSNRLAEGLIILSPHCIALLLTASLLGFLSLSHQASNVVSIALTLIGLLLAIRAAVFVLRVAVGSYAPIKGWGNTISWLVWIMLSLHVLGWFDNFVAILDGIGIKSGNTRISVWSGIKVIATITVFILIGAWIARWIEQRLMRMSAIAISMRIGMAKFIQAFLVGLSILLGLSAAGLDLTTLTVLTGAIGIGLGFGLQAITANFVSGFVLLLDRSIKPGDVISLSGVSGSAPEHFGWVQELRGRYVVIRDRDGVETLVPNQHLITNPVINWSYTDPRVRLRLPVSISYNDDPEQALLLLTQAAQMNRRILHDPPPVARLMSFADSGLLLELRFWISDPQEGLSSVRSDVNRAIWRLFKENGITIPVPQREVVYRMERENTRPSADEVAHKLPRDT